MVLKVLHVGHCDKFIPPFIKVLRENFEFREHVFLLTGGISKKEIKDYENIYLSENSMLALLVHYARMIFKMHQAKKIILHGLFERKLVIILFFMPWLLKKCYWVIWGGDLYVYRRGKRNWKWKVRELFLRRVVIRRIGHIVTYIKGDYELAQKWYGAQGLYHECFMYPSNLYKHYKIKIKTHNTTNILIGNSADPSNNHLDILDKLDFFKEQNIKIYAPLSYGNPIYAKQIIKEGRSRFGDKFIPLTAFISFEQYLELLADIDVAIFNHKRQQAMGNTITLLGLGKKVYMRSDVTQWLFFKEHEIKVFDNNVIDLKPLNEKLKSKNVCSIKTHFSEYNYLDQLKELFG